MTVMLVVLAAWVALSLIVGLTVGRAIRQADSAEFPARRVQWWADHAASGEAGAARTGSAQTAAAGTGATPSGDAGSVDAHAALPTGRQRVSRAA